MIYYIWPSIVTQIGQVVFSYVYTVVVESHIFLKGKFAQKFTPLFIVLNESPQSYKSNKKTHGLNYP